MAQTSSPYNARSDPMGKSQERIYSAQQLILALRSGLSSVREQLQVLTILDGTAASWPGVNQAVDDMDFLIDMSSKTTNRLEDDVKNTEAKSSSYKSEVTTLKDTLANANERCEELQAEVAKSQKEARQLTNKLDSATKEVNQQRQELWTLEKQRADLASDVEKFKQDTEFMEGEIGTLRTTANDQMQQLTALKEELAARKADVQHLQRSSQEYKNAAADLKKRLEATTSSLRTTQSQLDHTRTDRQHFEKEAGRLGDEASRLGAELSKTATELQRLKDWGEVLKKVEADKLREEQAGHTRTRFETEQAKAELSKTITRLTAEMEGKDERVISKTAEAHSATKQLGLLHIQLKDLQKQITTLQADKNNLAREREEGKAEVAKMQTKLQAAAMQMAKLDKERAIAESRAKEQAAAERARLQAASDDSRRESAVQKALAEGWSRDIKDLNSRLQGEQAQAVALRNQIDTIMRGDGRGDGAIAEKHLEMVKGLAVAEQVNKELQSQLNNKDAELRRYKAETSSIQKRLEKQVESLQRECNECGNELQRLRTGEAGRLPPVGHRPVSLQDELDNLKRYVHHGQPNGNVPSRLLPAVKQGSRQSSR